MVCATKAGGGRMKRATPVVQITVCHSANIKHVAAIPARQPVIFRP
jgi:hypothetical protein